MKEASSNFKPYLIEGFVGPMFSGKTRDLLKRIDPLRYDPRNYSYVGIKPEIDKRDFNCRSAEDFIDWNYVKNSKGVYELSKDFEIIAIDEIQFFDKGIVKVLLELQKEGKNIIFAGLDKDFRGDCFGPMPELMTFSNKLEKLHATCNKCGEPAYYTQRLIDGEPAHHESPIVLIEGSGKESYEPRCFKHHEVPGKD
jgi:thymidine kinase